MRQLWQRGRGSQRRGDARHIHGRTPRSEAGRPLRRVRRPNAGSRCCAPRTTSQGGYCRLARGCCAPARWDKRNCAGRKARFPARSVLSHPNTSGREACVVRSRAAEAGTSAVRPAAKSPLRGSLSLRPLAPNDLSVSNLRRRNRRQNPRKLSTKPTGDRVSRRRSTVIPGRRAQLFAPPAERASVGGCRSAS